MTNKQKKVLIIAYDFPPIGGSGVQRTLKFVKYLSRYGWTPVVLTVRENESVIGKRDYSMVSEIPKKAIIYRTNCFDPYDNIFHRLIMGTNKKHLSQITSSKKVGLLKRFRKKIGGFLHSLMVPDRLIGWYPYGIKQGMSIIKEQQPDMLFSTSPSATAHLIARYLNKRSGLPWVTDFRDPWTQYYFANKRPLILSYIEKKMEHGVLNKSSGVINLVAECEENFLSLYPSIKKEKYHIIPNGYDENDFKGVVPKKFDKFTLLFSGNLYQQVTPKNIFEALGNALKRKPHMRTKTQFLFVGEQYTLFHELIQKNKLEDVVKTIPYQEHKEAIAFILGAHACYYNVFSKLAITAKLFEYLRSGTFILATIPEDHAASKIITETQSGVVIAPDNIRLITKQLLELFAQYGSSQTIMKNDVGRKEIVRYERKKLTRKLATVFDNLI